MKCKIKDVSDNHTIRSIEVTQENSGLIIHPENTDTYDGNFAPIYLEFHNGVPVLYIWNNHNEQEPIEISLENTMITK